MEWYAVNDQVLGPALERSDQRRGRDRKKPQCSVDEDLNPQPDLSRLGPISAAGTDQKDDGE